jgi:hypothetical protein
MDIQDSNRLRIVAVRAGWPTTDIAAACGCSIEHAKKWLSDQHVLSPLYAAGIKRRWPQETASP